MKKIEETIEKKEDEEESLDNSVEANQDEESGRNDTIADDTREDEEESLDNSVESSQPLDGADEGRRDRTVSDLCIQLENSF